MGNELKASENNSRCSATTRSGNPCKNKPLSGSNYCRIHQPVTSAAYNAENVIDIQSNEVEQKERPGFFRRLNNSIRDDLLDADTWKGIWYMLSYSLQAQADQVTRRITGEYETDPWGLDWEVFNSTLPIFDIFYKYYWRVETTGIEKIPHEGRALLVSNHSGQLPWDGLMLATAIFREHPSQRLARTLFTERIPPYPFVSDFLVKCGEVLETEENGVHLLEQGELVAIFPEGEKGIGKLFKERYRLAKFSRNRFVNMAIRTGSPIIPVSIVGAEEIYISLAKSTTLARFSGLPYFPISPSWPWLGPLGLIPLPTKWYIDFGEPIPLDNFNLGDEDNLILHSQIVDQVRNLIQDMIYTRLSKRKSVFRG